MYKTSLLFAVALFSLSSCGEDVTYKQKYIELLESHILEIQGEEKHPQSEDTVEISEDQVRRQAEEFYLFLCGDMNNLLDLRLTEKKINEWYVLYRIKTSEFDEFGLAIEKNITLSVTAKDGKLQFDEGALNLGLCE
jgi:hypothetical protein